jgi:diguanylate cyclase (GGDEF)-like protein/PAS domain S-box-containing protein
MDAWAPLAAAAAPSSLAAVLAWQLHRCRRTLADLAGQATRAQRLAEIVEATPDLVAIVDVSGRCTYLNAAARRALGMPADADLGGVAVGEVYTLDSLEEVLSVGLPTAARNGAWAGEVTLRLPGGDDMPASQVVLAHPGEAGVDHYSSVTRDLRERKAFEAQLVHQALHDALTGLPNRVLFADRLAQARSRAGRLAGALAVLLLDLDHFKLVNDAYGHDVGDDLLGRAAIRIRGALRQGDTVARFGGDEFAVLCEDVRGPAEVDAIADRLAVALAEPFELAAGRVFLTASIGIALADEFPATAESLLRDADTAMSRAKERGRARAEVFVEDLRTSAVRRLRTADDLHRALEQEEFRVVYQPEIDLHDGHVPAVEALIRWHHPERGLVPPDEFVPLAEQTGLINGIGAWVLDQAVAQAADWVETLVGGSPVVWVNLSPRQLAAPNLVDLVRTTLHRHRVDPRLVGLEITESGLLEDAEAAIASIAALRRIGVRLAVDDFGTGYSSLSYLKRLPVDAVKVDRSFVDGVATDADNCAIVAAVTGMARALRLSAVAEGVETAEQLAALRALGVQLAQGFYFSRPQPAAVLTTLLMSDREAPLYPPPGEPGLVPLSRRADDWAR